MVPKKILFADDDEPKIIQVVSAYLEKEAYQVFTGSKEKRRWNLKNRL
jgi:DNA-binding response OmpR family regulator